jgi:hypothetical protein
MKNLILILVFVFAGAAQATSYTASSGGGNWNSASTWGGSGYPVAGDTANITSAMTGTVTVNAPSACAVLNCSGMGGTLTNSGSQTLTVTGNITLGGTITQAASTTFTLKLTGTSSQTITFSGSNPWPGALYVDIATGQSLIISNSGAQCYVSGLVTWVNNCPLNWSTSESLTCNAGFSQYGNISGSATVNFNGGTFNAVSGTPAWESNINITGSCTITNLYFGTAGTPTLTYSAGTVTTNGTLFIEGSSTLATNGMTWANVANILSSTIGLTNNLACTKWIEGQANQSVTTTFTGSGSLTATTWSAAASYALPCTVIIPVGGTLNIGSGGVQCFGNSNNAYVFKSASSGSLAYINYSGNAGVCECSRVTFTDCVNVGNQIFNFFGSTPATIDSHASGVINITPAMLSPYGGSAP